MAAMDSSQDPSAILKALTTQLECPVCFAAPMRGKIYMCVNGHNVCQLCQSRIKECPICREPGAPCNRNLGYEELANIKCSQGAMSNYFYVQNWETGLVLHIKNEHPGIDGEVIMSHKTGSSAQLWAYVDNTLVSTLNGLVLDVKEQNRYVITYTKHGGKNQRWHFNDDGTIGSGLGKVLDVEEGSVAAGARLIVWEYTGNMNQRFSRVSV